MSELKSYWFFICSAIGSNISARNDWSGIYEGLEDIEGGLKAKDAEDKAMANDTLTMAMRVRATKIQSGCFMLESFVEGD